MTGALSLWEPAEPVPVEVGDWVRYRRSFDTRGGNPHYWPVRTGRVIDATDLMLDVEVWDTCPPGRTLKSLDEIVAGPGPLPQPGRTLSTYILERLDPPKTPTALYRHYDAAGRLLYAGISLCAIRRTVEHKSRAPWFEDVATIKIERFDYREDALAAEAAAIRDEKPAFNKARPRAKLSLLSFDKNDKSP